jgi:hypothetical protein
MRMHTLMHAVLHHISINGPHMRPHFKTIGAIDCWKTIRSLKKFENKIISSPSLIYWQKYFPKICNCTVIM